MRLRAADHARVEVDIDVAVIGGGPAGAAAALSLAREGLNVALIDATTNGDAWKIGEGLPPLARRVLQYLSVWEDFNQAGHLPSYGNCAAWGSAQLQEHNFLFDPHGHGWHLERHRFDSMLRIAALKAGARDFTGQRVMRCQHTTSWELALAETSLTARCVIDASGCASWFARQQGALRQPHRWPFENTADALVGTAVMLAPQSVQIDQDSLTLIEAVETGWWYAALLPDRRLIMAYLSDADLPETKVARTADGWWRLLKQTEHLARRVAKYDYQLEQGPRVVAANSSRLDRVSGEGWLAAGDAALAYDPLSSQGIVAALEIGVEAAQAARAYLAGQAEALTFYARLLDERWAIYAANLSFYYAQEQRWPQAPFWQRRSAAAGLFLDSPEQRS